VQAKHAEFPLNFYCDFAKRAVIIYVAIVEIGLIQSDQ
jgi:hypothetical protein